MEYVALDLETTGLDPERDRVIEVGAVAFTPGGEVRATLQRLADPGRGLPDAVRRLTGLTADALAGAAPPEAALRELAGFLEARQAVGHGARLDLGFLRGAGLWAPGAELLDTLDLARILLPDAVSHSLPALARELGLEQPRPHRALDDADATRQLLVRLRTEAAGLEEDLKASIMSLIAPYDWAIARFFAEALAQPAGREPRPPEAFRAARPEPSGEGPPGVRRPADDEPEALAALLGPEGPAAGALEGFELREEQRQMVLAVAQAMQRGRTLVVEAGTGTGKSLAYLLPALARAVRRGERALVTTHTHTLQEQIVGKDIPELRRWLPWDFEASLLKGRSNYLSLRRWRRFLAEPCRDPDELRFKIMVMAWLRRTRTGDRAELRGRGPDEALWARVASDPLDCAGVLCSEAECFVHRARARAERSDLVVVNHALLVADASTGGSLLPEYANLVVDEAHHLAEVATQGLRSELEGPAVLALLERLAGAGPAPEPAGLLAAVRAQPRLGESGDPLAEAEPALLAAHARLRTLLEGAAAWMRQRLAPEPDRREDTLRLTPALRQGPEWERVVELAAGATAALAALDAQLRRAALLSPGRPIGEDPALRELEGIRQKLAEAGALLQQAFCDGDPNRVYWCAPVARGTSLALRSAPLEVGALLADQVYRGRRSVVLTSASLAVAGSLDYFAGRAGIGQGADRLVLASPFDYLEQALACLPGDLPEPAEDDFEPLVVEVVADLARRLGGRTLVLFTSHRQLRDVYSALKHRDDLDEVLILGQGIDGQRRQVLETFEEGERPLLLGTASLWEGIDLPGDRLSCVVIVRLPFPVPTDPIHAARAERLRDPFAEYALPMAVLRLKQGFGRLLRRRTDRGAVVILDGRIRARGYGRAFLEGLPPASRYLGPAAGVGAAAEAWVGGAAEPASLAGAQRRP